MTEHEARGGTTSAHEVEIDVERLVGRRAVHRWERTSVGDVFERLRWATPDKEAIVGWPGAFASPEHERLTCAQADDLANRIANALLGRGLDRGDRVLLVCDNSVEACVTKIAVAKAGLVCASLNPTLAPDVMAHLIERVQPRFSIVDAELWPKARDAFASTGTGVDVTIEIGGQPVQDSVGFAAFVRDASTVEPDVEIHADDICQLLFTSGTTAMPKAVMLSHGYGHLAGMSFALMLTRGLRSERELRLCTFLPMIYHVGDQIFLLSTLLTGGTFIVGRRPDPRQVAEAVSAERATAIWAGSPAMLRALVEVIDAAPELGCDAVTMAVYGWNALPPSTLGGLRRHYGDAVQACAIFGQTESISCHRFSPDEGPEVDTGSSPAQNCVGLPTGLLASKVVDEEGDDLPADRPGVAGEIVYRSPVMTAGYYRDAEATRAAFRGGWFHSGDSCAVGGDGRRIMIDRYKDIVKSGGENVSSLRVEAVLAQHPDVAQCAVVGLRHPRWGDAVTAVVVARDGHALDPDAVVAWARARLAGYEAPKRVVPVDELPVTVGGKVLKYKLRERFAELFAGAEEVHPSADATGA